MFNILRWLFTAQAPTRGWRWFKHEDLKRMLHQQPAPAQGGEKRWQ